MDLAHDYLDLDGLFDLATELNETRTPPPAPGRR